MTLRRFISTSILRAAISIVALSASMPMQAQKKFFSFQKDSIPVFRGFAVSFDLVGADNSWIRVKQSSFMLVSSNFSCNGS